MYIYTGLELHHFDPPPRLITVVELQATGDKQAWWLQLGFVYGLAVLPDLRSSPLITTHEPRPTVIMPLADFDVLQPVMAECCRSLADKQAVIDISRFLSPIPRKPARSVGDLRRMKLPESEAMPARPPDTTAAGEFGEYDLQQSIYSKHFRQWQELRQQAQSAAVAQQNEQEMDRLSEQIRQLLRTSRPGDIPTIDTTQLSCNGLPAVGDPDDEAREGGYEF